jgi:hypothetical protein
MIVGILQEVCLPIGSNLLLQASPGCGVAEADLSDKDLQRRWITANRVQNELTSACGAAQSIASHAAARQTDGINYSPGDKHE